MLKRKSSFIIGLTFLVSLSANAELVFKKRDYSKLSQDSQAQEDKRTPKLTKSTTLAGIDMPAATQLELLHDSEGEQWVKPEYFEKAFFPRPVMWQGVPITAMWRYLQSHRDNEPKSFKTSRITWGQDVTTTLAKPTTVEGFNCQAEIEWAYLRQDGEDNLGSSVDARLHSPAYHFASCILSGQTFTSKNGKMQVHLPAGNGITGDGWKDGSLVDTTLPKKSFLEIWSAYDDKGILQTNLFTLKGEKNFGLDKKDKSVIFVFGDIETGTAECPLKKGSYVQWRRSEPDTILVHNPQGVTHCGSLNVVPLKEIL